MKTKKVKYLISKKLQKEYNKIIKDKRLNKSSIIEELIKNYIEQNKPVLELTIDYVLDKIAHSGLSSLTKEEIDLIEK